MNASRVLGVLLGQAAADSIGSLFEGQTPDWLHGRFDTPEAMFRYAADAPRQYTDDTEMALAIAEYLCEAGSIEPNQLMGQFVRHYNSWRGYGRGTRMLMDAFRQNAEYEYMVANHFPGGSYGNGAAMRAAPVGIRFSDPEQIWEQAKLSAWPTHRHELGIEGAQLIALATRLAADTEDISPRQMASELKSFSETLTFSKQLDTLAGISSAKEVAQFGNGIEAHESAVTAIACFVLHPDSFERTVQTALWLGGDTDTVAAMAGALSGARLGASAIQPFARQLEPNTDFMPYVTDLAERLAKQSE